MSSCGISRRFPISWRRRGCWTWKESRTKKSVISVRRIPSEPGLQGIELVYDDVLKKAADLTRSRSTTKEVEGCGSNLDIASPIAITFNPHHPRRPANAESIRIDRH